ncbi:MAG: DNRLRE domain-containing protein [Azonexus sp.]|nr:DNRLRE domain-containing protein [Azonexus sp.]
MRRQAGFVLLPVVLAMSLLAVLAYMSNRSSGLSAALQDSEKAADRAYYAAEAGLQMLNAKIQALGCGASYPTAAAPVSNTTFGNAAYSAYSTAATGNVLTLVSTGTYQGRSITLTRNNVYVYPLTTLTYTLQPNGTAGIDTYIEVKKTANHGDEDKIKLKNSERFGLIKFDLSAFPVGSLVDQASLRLRVNSPEFGQLYGYRMLSSWSEGNGSSGVNWTTRDGSTAWTSAGGDYHPVSFASAEVDFFLYGYSVYWDIGPMMKYWVSGRYPNYGMRIEPSLFSSAEIVSSDDSSAGDRPRLQVIYYPPCGVTGPHD